MTSPDRQTLAGLDRDPSDPVPLARAALEIARRVTVRNSTLTRAVDQCEERLLGPLRVALAGKVKAGKSTLVNAFLGDELAPTDAGECTMVTTWYQHGRTPATRVVGRDGKVHELPFRRRQGQFVVDLAGLSPDEVARVEVDWPSPLLADLTLIDTPGIDSLTTEASDRTTDLLVAAGQSSAVDAVVYLMKNRHAVDLGFVTELSRTGSDGQGAATTLVVLSRADEISGGRIGSLISAREIAKGHNEDPLLRAHSVGVVPVAGLLAQGARMFRQDDYEILKSLSAVSKDDREVMLISTDRFVRNGAGGTSEQRAALVRRIGLFGIRLGVTLVKAGISSSEAMANELSKQSGLGQVEEVLGQHFLPRARILVARSTITALENLADKISPADREDLLRACDHFRAAGLHGLAEMTLLMQIRRDGIPDLDPGLADEARRLLGESGATGRLRLGLAEEDSKPEARAAVEDAFRRWSAVLDDPGSRRPTRRLAETILRTLDGLSAAVPQAV